MFPEERVSHSLTSFSKIGLWFMFLLSFLLIPDFSNNVCDLRHNFKEIFSYRKLRNFTDSIIFIIRVNTNFRQKTMNTIVHPVNPVQNTVKFMQRHKASKVYKDGLSPSWACRMDEVNPSLPSHGLFN